MKHHKKEKKHKKHKKSKKSKRTKHSSTSSESEEWEECEVSAPTKKESRKEVNYLSSTTDTGASHREVRDKLPLKNFQNESDVSKISSHCSNEERADREDWMISSSLLDAACSASSSRENKTKQRKVEERREDERKNQQITEQRELNPYWKKGQSGLPPEEDGKPRSQPSTGSSKRYGVGDSGRSWIQKAYERAKEQAKEEKIPLEEIVAKRWGSMEKLEALLKASSRQGGSKPSHSSSVRSSGSSGWRKHSEQSHEHKSSHRLSKLNTLESQCNKVDRNTAVKFHESKVSSDNDKTMTEEECSPHSALHDSDNTGHKNVKEITISEEEKNRINAKILRAELMGDDDLVAELKGKLLTDRSSGKSNVQSKVAPRKPLTEEEKNQLNAKILRAELMGDESLVSELKAKLEGTINTNNPNSTSRKRKDSEDDDADDDSDSGHEEVILTRSDKHGNLYPVKLNTLDQQKPKRKKIMSTHDESGQRVRYFEDDDSTDLKTMVEQEHLTSADDQQAMLARLAGKHLGKTMGEDYTLDDMFVQASATKGETKAEDKRIKEKAIAEHKQHKMQSVNCRYCFNNSSIAKHLIISVGSNVYLTLTLNTSLTEGHCLIVPANHVSNQTYMDEDVLQEVKKFKSNITRMFAENDEDVMFLETCKNLRSQPHCVIDCIPVPKEIGEMAPLYFKKAIMESESEWTQNKKLITVNAKDGITRAVPKGLPYFAVEFGLDGGFAHVIEEESFPHYFGKEVIGGMMDLEPRMWLKPPKESFEQHKRKIFKFTESWKKYDAC